MLNSITFKVIKSASNTVYIMLASALAIASWTAFIHRGLRQAGDLRPLTVIGDAINFLTGQAPTSLTSLSIWLRTEAGMVGIIALGAFVVGIIFFGRPNNEDTLIPAWFGAPTALIALAVFWEIQPRAGALMSYFALGVLTLVAVGIELWHARYVCGPERVAYLGYLLMNWIFTTAGLVIAPINLVYELKERRDIEAHTAHT